MSLDKASLRRIYEEKRRKLSGEECQKRSLAICKLIESLDCFCSATSVALYASDGVEVDLKSLFDQFRTTKKWFLPRYNVIGDCYEMIQLSSWENDLERGKYGLLEPKMELPPLDKEDAVNMLYLVPGVAFDHNGHRVGRGKGFYDRMLNGHKGVALGVCFDCQRSEEIASEVHDVCLDMVVTETEILKLKK